MRIFQTYEDILTYAVVRPGMAKNRQQKWINKLKLPFIQNLCLFAFYAMCMFVIHYAETSQEFSESIYALTTIATGIFMLTILSSKRKQHFDLIDNIQKAIEMRKFKSIFLKLSTFS